MDGPTSVKLTRRMFFAHVAAASVVPIAGGFYATQVEPFWPRFFELPVVIPRLPKSFEGFRVAHLTDLHAGRTQTAYLQRVVSKVVELKPDLVVVTGDLVHHSSAFAPVVAEMLGAMRLPVVASFGNHEYGVSRNADEPDEESLPDKMQQALLANGCTVLRNVSKPIYKGTERIWLVGLDDLWFGEFDPPAAFRDVPDGEATLALSHNPDTAEKLTDYAPDLILAGHTHGGQIRMPFYGPIRLNVLNPQWNWGLYRVGKSQMYVSSGVGYIRRVRFNCRPEVPIIRLTSG